MALRCGIGLPPIFSDELGGGVNEVHFRTSTEVALPGDDGSPYMRLLATLMVLFSVARFPGLFFNTFTPLQ